MISLEQRLRDACCDDNCIGHKQGCNDCAVEDAIRYIASLEESLDATERERDEIEASLEQALERLQKAENLLNEALAACAKKDQVLKQVYDLAGKQCSIVAKPIPKGQWLELAVACAEALSPFASKDLIEQRQLKEVQA